MPAVNSDRITLALVVQKLDGLIEEVKSMITKFDAFNQAREAMERHLNTHDSDIDRINETLEEHAEKIEELVKVFNTLSVTNKILSWLLIPLGGLSIALIVAVLGFLWSLLTHSIELTGV